MLENDYIQRLGTKHLMRFISNILIIEISISRFTKSIIGYENKSIRLSSLDKRDAIKHHKNRAQWGLK